MNKILLANICPSRSWGGLEINVYRLARWLKDRGHDNILYGFEGSPLYQACADDGLEVRPLNSKSKFSDIGWSFKLARMLQKDKVNLVFSHLNNKFLLVTLAKMLSGNSFMVAYDQHMHVGVDKKDFFHTWMYSKLDYWMAPVPILGRNVIAKTKVDPKIIRIIPRGIEMDKFSKNQPDKIEARQKFNLPIEAKIAGVIGRIDPLKGQHILIEATKKVHDAGHPIHVAIVGGNTLNETTGYDRKLRDMTDELKLNDYVHFLGHQKESEFAFAALDIFCMTTASETYGMVTIEAMASGLPVIGSNDGGTTDLLEHGKTGYLVKPFDSDELAEQIIYCLNHREEALAVGQNARKDALFKYSNTRQIDLLEELFDEIQKKGNS